MLELEATSFLGAATSLARVHQIFAGIPEAGNEPLIPESVALITPHLSKFRDEAHAIGARLAVMSADRVLQQLGGTPCLLTVGDITRTIFEVEQRFADYLASTKLFFLSEQENILLQGADNLIEMGGFSVLFPDASFEIEESSKCFAVGRYTACVFHAMRMMEIGIRALAKRLAIPDPTQPSEKNWGKILGSINSKIDELWPVGKRMPGSEGSKFEELYANLEAIRNPWRNATMHVETIYAPHEAIHILRCCAFFMRRLSDVCDEGGEFIGCDGGLDLQPPALSDGLGKA